jgi:hypothetical protein
VTLKATGTLLMWLGALVGVAAGIWVAVGVDRGGLPWLIGVGLVKLTVVASFGLMGAGAMMLRIANRQSKEASVAELDSGTPDGASSPDHRSRDHDRIRTNQGP